MRRFSKSMFIMYVYGLFIIIAQFKIDYLLKNLL